MNLQFTEVEFLSRNNPADAPRICIVSLQPIADSPENRQLVADFCKKDMEMLGVDEVAALIPLTHSEALAFYSFDEKTKYPVFGTSLSVSGSRITEDEPPKSRRDAMPAPYTFNNLDGFPVED